MRFFSRQLGVAVASSLIIGSAGVAVATGALPRASAGTAAPPTEPGTTLYVGVAGCSDSGPATQAQPLCTLQAAADIVNPGQTVVIEASLTKPATITRSGTPSEPITFKSDSPTTRRFLIPTAAAGKPVVTLQGVHDVALSALGIDHIDGDDGIDVTGSSSVTLDGLQIVHLVRTTGMQVSSAGVSIDGGSADITVSRTQINSTGQYALHAAAGAQRVTAAGDVMYTAPGIAAVSLDGVAGAVVTGNTILATCTAATSTSNGMALTGGTSAVVEDNIIEAGAAATANCPGFGAALTVDSASASGVKASYNAFDTGGGPAAYSWAGVSYDTAAAFQALGPAGQGANDVDLTAAVGIGTPVEGSAAIDSADCTAPDYLSTDIGGHPRVADPLATSANLAKGDCHGDRGAFERQDATGFTATVSQSVKTTDGIVSVALTNAPATSSAWGEAMTYTASWGDGSDDTVIAANGTGTHQYTAAGSYTVTVTAQDTSGSSTKQAFRVPVYTTAVPGVTMAASARDASGVVTPMTATFTGGLAQPEDAWEMTSGSIDFGDGIVQFLPAASLGAIHVPHAYSSPGTYTATLTEQDALSRVTTATATITVGDMVRPVAPVRDAAISIPGNSTLSLAMADLHAAGARAALLTVTVTRATTAGYLLVFPDGSSTNQAPVQFGAGQQASNVVLATAGSASFVDFFNASASPVSVVIATIGIEDSTGGGMYTPVTPAPVLPATQIAGNHHVAFPVAGGFGVPATAKAVVVEVTASGTAAAGHFTTYAEAASSLQQQGAYWAKGQQATGFAIAAVNGRVGLLNVGTGIATFTAHVVGYYGAGPDTAGVFLPAPPRMRLVNVIVAAKHAVKLAVSGKNGVPATGTTAAQVELTATGASAAGTVLAYQDGATPQPALPSLSYTKGVTSVNAAIVAIGSDGAIDVYNAGSSPVRIAVDLTGAYYAYPG